MKIQGAAHFQVSGDCSSRMVLCREVQYFTRSYVGHCSVPSLQWYWESCVLTYAGLWCNYFGATSLQRLNLEYNQLTDLSAKPAQWPGVVSGGSEALEFSRASRLSSSLRVTEPAVWAACCGLLAEGLSSLQELNL